MASKTITDINKPRKQKLTDKRVSALPVDGTNYDVTDTLCKGLHLRVRQGGAKAWCLWLYTPDRTQRYRWRIGDASTFKVYENTPSNAANRQRSIRDVAELLKAKALEVDLRADRRAKIAKTDTEKLAKLGDFITLHYADHYKAEGYAEPERMIKWFKGTFGDMLDMRMDKITHLTVRKWLTDQKKTKADSTVARLQGGLSGVLSEAVAQGYIPHHPLQKNQRDNAQTPLKLVKQGKGIIRWLNEDEEKKLRAALLERDRKLKSARLRNIAHKQERGMTPPLAITGAYADHMTPLILLAMNTGIRRSALLGMNWKDIKPTHIHVTKSLDKANKGYNVDMNSEVKEVLRLWKRQTGGEGLVFKYRGKSIYSIKTAWGNLMKAAKITNFRFHDLRHHFATRLAESGAAPATIKALMGHSSIEMTDKYMHATDKMKSSAVELIKR